tara:strand:+ start:59136 stop:60140 length:1005 start_codon:yes stop_codon:yes gene_type:complete
MRCLVLAEALRARGWECEFLTGEDSLAVVPHLARSAHEITTLACNRLSDPDTLTERLHTPATLIIIDHYGLDATYESRLRGIAEMVLVIDDLADRPHDCDILLDQTLGRDANTYKNLVPEHCQVLTGSRHALLRPGFAAIRNNALTRRRQMPAVTRILVSMGMTDPANDTCTALNAIQSVGPDAAIDVILGPGAPHLAKVRAKAGSMSLKVTVHVDPTDVAGLVADADIAIGAGGSASWERCCLGLPTLVFAYGPVQELVVQELHHAGAIELVPPGTGPDDHRLAAALHRLVTDDKHRLKMALAAGAICDGLGANRIVEALKTRTKPQFSKSGH